MLKRISILGSTGSIGTNTLDVVRKNRSALKVRALSAHSRLETLAAQIREFEPDLVALTDERGARLLKSQINLNGTRLLSGVGSLEELAVDSECDLLVSALSGAAGFLPALAAVTAGKNIAIANKEALVMGGDLIMAEAKRSGSRIFPLDSEHNAIYQLLQGCPNSADLNLIYLTASGGPFLHLPLEAFHTITPSMALSHPTWVMGKKITIDSATMMNKGLELIEARWLFDVNPDQLSVVIHPQSLIHGAIQKNDGSIVALMSPADMRVTIANILSPSQPLNRLGIEPLSLSHLGRLDFLPLDRERFPSFALAEQALAAGGTAPAVLNAANEIAVEAFLAGQLPYLRIPDIVRETLRAHSPKSASAANLILEADLWARTFAHSLL
ncbi:MAG: 1-deoxy-D-xylulose-5-phosphate reductoisomerase [Deltaproteobacteria bacterium]|nr:1-deoxy-D-xylulose-5-phosphate reductoisomerase [Deltaproteobacteria bacterium]